MELLWLLPGVLAARFLGPRGGTGRDSVLPSSKTIPEAIPFSDPYNPSLDDPRNLPMELQPERYRGRIVYAKPVQHQGQTNLAATFSDVPFSSKSRTVRKMINNKMAYDTSNYSMVLPWDMPAPRIRNRPRFYDNLKDHPKNKPLFSTREEEDASTVVQEAPPIKKICKRWQK